MCECVYPGDLCMGCAGVHEDDTYTPTTNNGDSWYTGYLDATNVGDWLSEMYRLYNSSHQLLSEYNDHEFLLLVRIMNRCGIYPEHAINIDAIRKTCVCMYRLGWAPQDELIAYLDKLVAVREKQKILTEHINTHANLYEAYTNCEYWEYLEAFGEYL